MNTALETESRLFRLREKMAAAACPVFFSLDAAANQYLTGFQGSTSAVLVYRDRARFLCDFRYTEQANHQVRGCAVEQVSGTLEQNVGRILAEENVSTAGFEPERLSYAQWQTIQGSFSGTLKPLANLVSVLRQIKSRAEIALIREASELAEDALAEILGELREGVTESEIAAKLEYAFKRRGAQGASFDTIALFGAHSSLPHGKPGTRALEMGDIVLIDCGCILDGYCSDLTRTAVFGRISPPWFAKIFEVTLQAQEAALRAIRPGVVCAEVDAIARNIISAAGYGDYFGHGLGHGVGLEVHEQPRLNTLYKGTLEAGMIVTVEPGIYLPGKGGVRIEDLVVVTEDGCDVLTHSPKQLRTL